MNKIFLLLLAFLMISSCASKSAPLPRACGETPHPESKKEIYKSTNVSLSPKPSTSHFYLYIGESEPYHHYAILVRPELLTQELENELKENGPSHWSEVFLEKIKHDLPIRENTDISKYGFISSALMSQPRSIFTNLIAKGQASIIDFWNIETDGSPATINGVIVAYIGTKGGKAREVCTPYGETIYSVVDISY